MIVEWNPQTVKRRPGEVDIVLDAGQCIGGQAAQADCFGPTCRALTTQPAGDDPQFSQRNFRGNRQSRLI